MKITGIGEQYDSGRDIFVDQQGSHIMLSVDAQDGARQGVALLTPAQARAVSTALLQVAEKADQAEMERLS